MIAFRSDVSRWLEGEWVGEGGEGSFSSAKGVWLETAQW